MVLADLRFEFDADLTRELLNVLASQRLVRIWTQIAFLSNLAFLFRLATTIGGLLVLFLQMIRRSRKTVRTTSIIVILFVACWIPYSVLRECIATFGHHVHTVAAASEDVANGTVWHAESDRMLVLLWWFSVFDDWFYVLLLFNGIADPVIYALRMRQVRRGEIQVKG